MHNYIWDVCPKRIAEIGVFEGQMSRRLLGRYANIEEYWGIDPYKPYEELGGPNIMRQLRTEEDWDHLYGMVCIKMSRYPQFTLMRLPSEEASKLFPDGYFDFVFIDGNHLYAYVKKDIKCWLPKVREGGGLSGHDYGVARIPWVKRAVDELIEDPIILPGTVWLHIVN